MSHTKRKPQTHCQKYGHSWQNTTSDTYRRCSHHGCRVAQCLVNGTWKETPTQGPTKERASATSEQTPLWS